MMLTSENQHKIENEISLMQDIGHSNLVRYFMYKVFDAVGMKFVDIIMTYCDGSLEDFIQNPNRFSHFTKRE